MTTPRYLGSIYRDSAWWINAESPPIILTDDQPVPITCAFPPDGVRRQTPEVLFDYQYDLANEAEQILRATLAVMTDYHQVRKLGHFLLGVCDSVEFDIYTPQNRVQDCQFQIRYSNGVAAEFSTLSSGITLWWQQKPRTFHKVDLEATVALQNLANELWPSIQDLPIWEITLNEKCRRVYRRRDLK